MTLKSIDLSSFLALAVNRDIYFERVKMAISGSASKSSRQTGRYFNDDDDDNDKN
jgi:hypothetical protein